MATLSQPSPKPDMPLPPPALEGPLVLDTLYHTPLYVCWSLLESKEFHGELPAMSQHSKDVALKEACLWKEREDNKAKYEQFMRDISGQ